MADWARAQSPAAVEEILDRENKRMADSLASKVTRLKSLALDIDRDAEDQNRYLDSMDSDFTSMTGLLTGSMKRFSTMARSGRDNRKLLCASADYPPCPPLPGLSLPMWPAPRSHKRKDRHCASGFSLHGEVSALSFVHKYTFHDGGMAALLPTYQRLGPPPSPPSVLSTYSCV
ncbi:BET1-like protein isoform X2 [Ursus americanus]|uniref:BET1-like protein isoform X2 n=1 Tax=Ursus americanus TaxID=9643 RepID=UPI001E67ABD0|nr:BET1-like protein isoform X2 [Ursus americanus]